MPIVLRPETLSRQAYRALRRAIRDRIFEAEKLYSEAQVASVLKISRTPVREALIELERQGVIDKIPQRGFRIRTISEQEQREVFDLRTQIETYVVRRLVREASGEQLAELREILQRQAKLTRNLSAFLDVDEEFHLAMPSLLGLERTREMLLSVRGIIWLSGSAALARSERTTAVLREHGQVVDKIDARDADSAAESVARHIRNTARAVGLRGPDGERSAVHDQMRIRKAL